MTYFNEKRYLQVSYLNVFLQGGFMLRKVMSVVFAIALVSISVVLGSLRLHCRHLRPLHLLLAGFLFFSITPATHGFITFHHEQREELDQLLIAKVHAPHWTIHYNFENCGPVDEETEKKYTQIATVFLQSWLQPLREYTDRPIVNDFRYKLNADWRGADFAISVICEAGRSGAISQPPLGIRHRLPQLELTWLWMDSLLHELGHLFGLADTYLEIEDWGKPGLDTGAFDGSRGSQPSSIMSGAGPFVLFLKRDGVFDHHALVPLHGIVPMYTDDCNGILYLYKYYHEDHPKGDCFFPDYIPVKARLKTLQACEPRYPLIHEVRSASDGLVEQILRDDPTLDINGQDASGFTALHHAVQRGSV